jgi:hypothetical protein
MKKLRREMNQINTIRNQKGDVATNTNKIQGINREYFENKY